MRALEVLCTLDCKDKDRLLFEYNRCVQAWSRAVQRLVNQAGSHRGTYLMFLAEINEAQAKAQRAKAVYATHVEEHGC